jgi:hypothetical protein
MAEKQAIHTFKLHLTEHFISEAAILNLNEFSCLANYLDEFGGGD